MSLIDRDQEIEILAADCSHQSLTKRIRLGRSDRCLQRLDTKSFQRRIRGVRENTIPIMDYERMGMIRSKELAELLDGPFCGWMGGDVGVQNPSRADLHGHKDI